METIKALDVEEVVIKEFPYRGKMYEVKGISVRWLSKCGDDGHGNPEYGLRLFTAQPGGEIPIHNHFYHQTMYITEGEFECYAYDAGDRRANRNQALRPGIEHLHTLHGAPRHEEPERSPRELFVLHRQCV